ncbi:MAG: trypsin-like peptidase domain-containing protein [Saprospiraceae bacterium]|nr:trypsin-like peptidase domain-containing protein [Saprospiraceae bacterium]
MFRDYLKRYSSSGTKTAYSNEVASRRQLNPEETATISLFEAAAPSVAFINTSTYRQDYWTRDITEIPQGSGSGFVWDKEGHIVTNFHVIQDADKAIVTLSDQSTWEADLVGYASEKDLAILRIKVPKDKLVPIPIGTSADLMVGQSVYAIGNPFGLDQTLTTGIISALGREIKTRSGTPIRDVIQTDAAINPGNSGGPLLDSQGSLIGVNTAIYSPSGAFAGIGFSIPVDQVNWVVSDLIKYGRVKRPTLGVELLPQSTVSRAGIEGAVVSNVQSGSAAAKAGILPIKRNNRGEIVIGDIIVGLNDEKVKTNSDLLLSLEKYKPGDAIDLIIMRADKATTVKVVLDPSR